MHLFCQIFHEKQWLFSTLTPRAENIIVSWSSYDKTDVNTSLVYLLWYTCTRSLRKIGQGLRGAVSHLEKGGQVYSYLHLTLASKYKPNQIRDRSLFNEDYSTQIIQIIENLTGLVLRFNWGVYDRLFNPSWTIQKDIYLSNILLFANGVFYHFE